MPRAAAFSPSDAVVATLAAWIAGIVTGQLVIRATGEVGLAPLVGNELMFLLVPLVLVLLHGLRMDSSEASSEDGADRASRGRRRLPWDKLGLGRPAQSLRVDLLAAVLVGSSLWYVNLWLVALLPLPTTSVQPLQQLVEKPALPIALVCIAVLPAICEELTFRGLLARSLATRLHPAWAIALQAAMFSAYHLSLVQMIPTFTLGLVLGVLALRAGSTVPAMVGHLVNNCVALIVAREDLPAFSERIDAHPVGALGVALGLASIGVALALRPATRGTRNRARVTS